MKKLVTITALILSSLTLAQQDKIEVTYTSRLILPEDFSFQPPGGGNARQMPKEMMEEMKKRIQEPQEAILTILGEQSTYKIVEKISNDQQSGGRGPGGRGGFRMNRFGGSDNIYKDISTKVYMKEVNMMSKSYTVKDDLPTYDWKITRETRTIMGNEARKATLEKDGKLITAWFTAKIPAKNGPENYWGLPGLILEIEAEVEQGPVKGKRIITISDIKTVNDKKPIEAPKAKTTITEAELSKLQQEQRERFEQMRDQGVNRRD